MKDKEASREILIQKVKKATLQLTSGTCTTHGQFCLKDEEFLNIVEMKHMINDAERERIERIRLQRSTKSEAKFLSALKKHRCQEDLLADDLRALIKKVKRDKKDSPLKKSVGQLRAQWERRKHRIADIVVTLPPSFLFDGGETGRRELIEQQPQQNNICSTSTSTFVTITSTSSQRYEEEVLVGTGTSIADTSPKNSEDMFMNELVQVPTNSTDEILANNKNITDELAF